MALHTVDAFVAKFRSIGVEAVVAVLRLPDDVAVRAILVAHVPEDEVAISAVEGHVAVVRVLAVRVHDGHARDGAVENRDLIEERLREIRIDPVIERVPFVAPPLVQFVDREGNVLVVHRDDLLPRQIARTVVEIEKIAEDEPALSAAIRAVNGIGYVDGLVECSLFGEEIEGGRTLIASRHFN